MYHEQILVRIFLNQIWLYSHAIFYSVDGSSNYVFQPPITLDRFGAVDNTMPQLALYEAKGVFSSVVSECQMPANWYHNVLFPDSVQYLSRAVTVPSTQDTGLKVAMPFPRHVQRNYQGMCVPENSFSLSLFCAFWLCIIGLHSTSGTNDVNSQLGTMGSTLQSLLGGGMCFSCYIIQNYYCLGQWFKILQMYSIQQHVIFKSICNTFAFAKHLLCSIFSQWHLARGPRSWLSFFRLYFSISRYF